MWFTERGSTGRISVDGKIRRFVDPSIYGAEGITTGPDGALWFTKQRGINGGSIGRISTDGRVGSYTDPSIKGPAEITSGPDGALWFTDLDGNSIDRIGTTTPADATADFATLYRRLGHSSLWPDKA